ncbi:hypothetical protein ASF82_14050 [Frigoribacterium sp. Leaf164]|nr:hypothetical protein [Frigoribacterium sp. Leaf164]KQR44534.1 hypothetical protein ASF82_14050 [Frigoribacterium sp. Leaf164]
MKLLAGITAALLLALGLLVLAVRADPDVPLTLTAAETDIPWCSTDEPVIVVDLSTDALPTCAPHGVEMRFPDGAVIDLPDEPGTGARSVGVQDLEGAAVAVVAAGGCTADAVTVEEQVHFVGIAVDLHGCRRAAVHIPGPRTLAGPMVR